MTDKELRESTRNNYYAQLAGLGYGTDGMPLEDRVTVVRCKNCVKKKTSKCPLMYVDYKTFKRLAPQEASSFINQVLIGEWYCVDGKEKE